MEELVELLEHHDHRHHLPAPQHTATMAVLSDSTLAGEQVGAISRVAYAFFEEDEEQFVWGAERAGGRVEHHLTNWSRVCLFVCRQASMPSRAVAAVG